MTLLTRFVCLLPFLAATASLHGQGQALLYTVPFQSGDERARIYRIPAIWWAPKKPLMAFAEWRMEQRRMFGDVDIVLRRSLDHGQSWQPQQVVANLERDTCGNPCIVQDASNNRL